MGLARVGRVVFTGRKSGEFFAFWGFAGKGAYMLGPLIFGAVSSFSGSQRVAIFSTVVFFVIGLFGMFHIDERRGHEAAVAWRENGMGKPVIDIP
ncbi:MAG: MFS transporter [Thermoanaerobaculia bacterium]|nr:MFS transporter [Thermoanaerobaculia bacterium]